MPGTVDSNALRKVRCPKCTVRLTEPPTSIYQCPMCSTYLLAKGTPVYLNAELLPESERDAESSQQTLEGFHSELKNDTLESEPTVSVDPALYMAVGRGHQDLGQEGIKCTVEKMASLEEEGGYNQDNCNVPVDHTEKQVLLAIDHVENEVNSLKEDSRPSHVPALQGCKSDSDVLMCETSQVAQLRGRELATDRFEGHDFEFDVKDSFGASQALEIGGIGRDAGKSSQMLNRSGKDPEMVQQIPEGLSKHGVEIVRCDSSYKQVQLGMDCMGEELESLEWQRKAKQEMGVIIDDSSKKQQQQERNHIESEPESFYKESGPLLTSEVEESLDESHAMSTENIIQINCRDGETLKQIPQQLSELESDALISEPGKKQSHYCTWVNRGENEGWKSEGAVTDNNVTSLQLANGHKESDAESERMPEPNKRSDTKAAEVIQQTQLGVPIEQKQTDMNGTRKAHSQCGLDHDEEKCRFSDGLSEQDFTSVINGSGKRQEQSGKMFNVEKDAVVRNPTIGQNLGMDCLEIEKAAPDELVEQVLKLDGMDNCEASHQQMMSHNETGIESTHITLAEVPKHNKDGGRKETKETAGEWAQEETGTVFRHSGEKQGQPQSAFMEKEPKSFEEVGRSKQKDCSAVNNKSSDNQGQQGGDWIENEGRSSEEVGGLLTSPGEGNSNDSHGSLTSRFLHENCDDSEMSERMPMLGKDAVFSEQIKKERQQGKDCVAPDGNESQKVNFDVTGDCENTMLAESIREAKDAESTGQAPAEIVQHRSECSTKQGNASVSDDCNKKHRQRRATKMYEECEPSDGECMRWHFPSAKENPDFNSRSEMNLEHENRFGSEPVNAGQEGLGTARNSVVLEQLQGMEDLPEENAMLDRVDVQGCNLGLLDNDAPIHQEASDDNESDDSKALAHVDDTNTETAFMIKKSGLNCGSTFTAETVATNGAEPLGASTTNITESIQVPGETSQGIDDSLPHACIGTESEVVCSNQTTGEVSEQSLQLLHGADVTVIADDAGEESLKKDGTGSLAVCRNQMTREVSEQSGQWLHGGDGAIFVDKDGYKSQRKHGMAPLKSHNMDMPNLEASLRYDDVWTTNLGYTERLESVDTSFCEWQPAKVNSLSEYPNKSCKDAGIIAEKGSLNSNVVFVSASTGCGDGIYALPQDENLTLKQGMLTDEHTSVIQSKGCSDLNNTDFTSAILGTDRTINIGRSTIPLRTAAMQKFLERTGKEGMDQMRLHYQELETKIYNAPYIEEYHPSPVSSTANNSRGKLGFGNQHLDVTNGVLLPGSKTWQTDIKSDSPNPSTMLNKARNSRLREDGCMENASKLNQGQENLEAVLQKPPVAEGFSLSNVSDMSGSGHFPRSYQHLETKVATSVRPQTNDQYAKQAENCLQQIPKARDVLEFREAMSRDRKRTSVNEIRGMNAVSIEQADYAHAEQQEQNNPTRSQKYQTYNGVMDQGSGYLLQGPTDSICSYPLGRSQESSPRLSSTEKYASYPRASVNSTGWPYSFQGPSQIMMHPSTIHDCGFGHCAQHSVSPVCAFCRQQAQVRQPHLLHNMMQHHCAACFPQMSSMAHQPAFYDRWESHQAHHVQPSTHDTSDRLCQSGSGSPQAQRLNKSHVQNKLRPSLPRRHRHFPPLPREGAVPYVLCQECDQLLEVPEYLPPCGGNTQKLRCGACGKISKFSICQPTDNCKFGSSRSSTRPWSVQSSTSCKVHPETAISHPYGHNSTVSTSDHGKQFLISKAAQRVESPRHQQVESPCHDVLGGRAAFVPGVRPHHEWVDNQMLHQTDSNARTTSTAQSLDYRQHPRSMTGVMQVQENLRSRSRDGQCDRLLNTSGTNGRLYLSSLSPSVHRSSPRGNVSDLCVEQDQMERNATGGKILSNGMPLHSPVIDQDGQAVESSNHPVDSFHKAYNKSKLKFSALTMQGSHGLHSTESVGNESLGRHQMPWTETTSQQHMAGPGHSRSSSKGSAGQFRKSSTAPGSPLIEHFDGFGTSLWQRVSGNGPGSAPRSPGSPSPLYDLSVFDGCSDYDERPHQKEHDSSSKLRGHITQDMGRQPKSFADRFKKSFKDMGKGGQLNSSHRKVTINGMLIPDAAVKKAEERAGVISPGSYWYDYQAGFWGVTGGPCLGIIPPFIEELNSPLFKDCAGGRTGVLVNGRELHHKDLKLLAGRGLPTTPGKAYLIGISGKVVDRASGQQLGSLGKLAPTIEERKCGHGMRPPSDVQSV